MYFVCKLRFIRTIVTSIVEYNIFVTRLCTEVLSLIASVLTNSNKHDVLKRRNVQMKMIAAQKSLHMSNDSGVIKNVDFQGFWTLNLCQLRQ